jgi:hypothetical protein
MVSPTINEKIAVFSKAHQPVHASERFAKGESCAALTNAGLTQTKARGIQRLRMARNVNAGKRGGFWKMPSDNFKTTIRIVEFQKNSERLSSIPTRSPVW